VEEGEAAGMIRVALGGRHGNPFSDEGGRRIRPAGRGKESAYHSAAASQAFSKPNLRLQLPTKRLCKGEGEIQGSLHYATDDKAVHCSGREDVFTGFKEIQIDFASWGEVGLLWMAGLGWWGESY
jgi:hypothetical protein